ncbi:hypothetical protein U9M48_031973 [Paspalum notatum var. saurae]|uniref:Uncharacterized protein n=1 Tax=Paspalum notatum var. saurae TaxID=547442 RepID=A0AAQ3U508_PASNO
MSLALRCRHAGISLACSLLLALARLPPTIEVHCAQEFNLNGGVRVRKLGLRMAAGDGEDSYASNSRIPKKAILEVRPLLQEATKEVYKSLPPGISTMVVADLGCSAGPNTLLFISGVMSTICDCVQQETDDDEHRGLELQFFLNDLPGNDFNLIFRSLEQIQSRAAKEEKTAAVPPYYVAGLPGSFYTRLFPCQSVHLFHSSFSLMWLSQVPEDLSNGTHLNEGNMYIGKATPPAVVKLFQEQFREDFALFLTLRYRELVCCGHMSEDILMHGDVARMWELLSEALQTLVRKGRVKQENMTSFNLPYYAPSLDEVRALVKQSRLFEVERSGLFEFSWDPEDDDSSSDTVFDCVGSGENVAKCIRAVIGPLIIDHFGEAILDELFQEYASIVTKHLMKGKAKYPVIVVSVKRAVH